MNTNKRNHDYDLRYRKRTAWRQVKEAIGQGRMMMLLRRLERVAGEESVREHLAAALHAYNTLTTDARQRVRTRYYTWEAMIAGQGAADRIVHDILSTHLPPPREAPAAETIADSPLIGSTIDVDGYAYTVRRSTELLYTSKGVLCSEMLVNHGEQELVIAPGVPASQVPRLVSEGVAIIRRDMPAQRADDEDDDEGEEWKGRAAA